MNLAAFHKIKVDVTCRWKNLELETPLPSKPLQDKKGIHMVF